METISTQGNPWGKAIDLSEVHEVLSLLTYQQLNILLEREAKRIWQLRQDEEAITQTKRDRRREWFTDMGLFTQTAVRSAIKLLPVRRHKKAIAKPRRNRRQEWLSDFRLLAFAMTRSVLSFWGIMGWMFVGSVFGGLMVHNFLSQAVLCNQPVCMWLRFDGKKVLE